MGEIEELEIWLEEQLDFPYEELYWMGLKSVLDKIHNMQRGVRFGDYRDMSNQSMMIKGIIDNRQPHTRTDGRKI